MPGTIPEEYGALANLSSFAAPFNKLSGEPWASALVSALVLVCKPGRSRDGLGVGGIFMVLRGFLTRAGSLPASLARNKQIKTFRVGAGACAALWLQLAAHGCLSRSTCSCAAIGCASGTGLTD